jgi:hypothetical protein
VVFLTMRLIALFGPLKRGRSGLTTNCPQKSNTVATSFDFEMASETRCLAVPPIEDGDALAIAIRADQSRERPPRRIVRSPLPCIGRLRPPDATPMPPLWAAAEHCDPPCGSSQALSTFVPSTFPQLARIAAMPVCDGRRRTDVCAILDARSLGRPSPKMRCSSAASYGE